MLCMAWWHIECDARIEANGAIHNVCVYCKKMTSILFVSVLLQTDCLVLVSVLHPLQQQVYIQTRNSKLFASTPLHYCVMARTITMIHTSMLFTKRHATKYYWQQVKKKHYHEQGVYIVTLFVCTTTCTRKHPKHSRDYCQCYHGTWWWRRCWYRWDVYFSL
jgi:hypothetical protein